MAKARSPARFKGHRAFAWLWDGAVRRESARERSLRDHAARDISGRVLDIGAGLATNRAYVPDGVDYVGIEPDPHMLGRGRRSDPDAVLIRGRAEALPFAPGSFDAVLLTFTLCTVQHPREALAEIYRVLRPGGELRFVEHIRPRGRITGRGADLVTPCWKRCGGGCHPNRRSDAAIVAAGFDVRDMRETRMNGVPVVSGVAAVTGDDGRHAV